MLHISHLLTLQNLVTVCLYQTAVNKFMTSYDHWQWTKSNLHASILVIMAHIFNIYTSYNIHKPLVRSSNCHGFLHHFNEQHALNVQIIKNIYLHIKGGESVYLFCNSCFDCTFLVACSNLSF